MRRRLLVIATVFVAIAAAVYVWNPFDSPSWSIVGRLVGREYFVVPGHGMEPTISAKGHVLICHGAARAMPAVQGAVVVFRVPGNEDILYLKRVAATAGHVIEIRNGSVIVDNGTPLRWFQTYSGVVDDYSLRLPPVRIPQGTFYALGDNLSGSIDSRRFGPVPDGNIVSAPCDP